MAWLLRVEYQIRDDKRWNGVKTGQPNGRATTLPIGTLVEISQNPGLAFVRPETATRVVPSARQRAQTLITRIRYQGSYTWV